MLRTVYSLGASPHLAIRLKGGRSFEGAWTAQQKQLACRILTALDDTEVIHLLADHGAFSLHLDRIPGPEWAAENSKFIYMHKCDYLSSASASKQICRDCIHALRQVGIDAWCDGGQGIHNLLASRIKSNLLDQTLVGHLLQLRLRLSEFETLPTDFEVGTRVVLHSLTAKAMNGKKGIVASELGANGKEGRHSVRISKESKSIRPRNLRPLVDPGRAAVAGLEVDCLQSFVVSGITGVNRFYNGRYELDLANSGEWPVFTHERPAASYLRNVPGWKPSEGQYHLFHGSKAGKWYFCITPIMLRRRDCGCVATNESGPSPLNVAWDTYKPGGALGGVRGLGPRGGFLFDPTIVVDTPTWIGGIAPSEWIKRDALVESFNADSHEFKLVFQDHEQTTRWLRLDHYRFLDWNVLPLRHAAMIRPRTVMAMLIAINRLAAAAAAAAILDEPPLDASHVDVEPETPGFALQRLMRYALRTGKDFDSIFREHVWPSVLAAPCPHLAARLVDATTAKKKKKKKKEKKSASGGGKSKRGKRKGKHGKGKR